VWTWRKVTAACRPPGLTCVTWRLTAKISQEQLQNPTLGNRVWATFTFLPQNPKHCSHFRYCRQKERWSSAAATDAYWLKPHDVSHALVLGQLLRGLVQVHHPADVQRNGWVIRLHRNKVTDADLDMPQDKRLTVLISSDFICGTCLQ